MKIRNGFVSNSSSSSYIVEVPKGFVITLEDIKDSSEASEEFCDVNECFDENNQLNQKAVDIINSELLSLSNGQVYYRDGWNNKCGFFTLREILKDHNMVIMHLDGPGGDGQDVIIPFEDERKKVKK